MLRVVIESPLGSSDPEIYAANVAYARLCMLDSIKRGESPYASHLLYTQVLDDQNLEQRELGIEAGLAWSEVAELAAIYTDHGMTAGMQRGIKRHRENGVRVERRTLSRVG